ncbi:MAG: sugar phosphate isomerase/epimerase [Ruminococcaceae bacterium]|nr:sugar phosphate isomerase/epimerase [Oscillospiraceae bacterium]
MKLATSTGDFTGYAETTADKVKAFKGSKFKYINLEQTRVTPEYLSHSDDDLKKLHEKLLKSAEFAGVEYVVSHAPCFHFAIPDALNNKDNEEYKNNVNAIRRSIIMCNMLGIKRTVVHACVHSDFSVKDFYKYNTMFYRDIFETAEKCGVTIMTENWDNNSTHFSTGKEIRDFIEHMDHPLFAACWDTAHGNIDEKARNIGQYENILYLGDKLKGLHISDNFGDCHHHTWPFAGIIKFDSVMQALLDVNYDGYFTFEASYTLLHSANIPYHREPWEHNGKTVSKLLDPPIELKIKAVDLLYDVGKYILDSYGCFEK